MKNLPKLNSLWSDGNGKKFTVTDLKEDDKGIWVYYTNINDKKDYSTLVGAFLNRFTEIPK